MAEPRRIDLAIEASHKVSHVPLTRFRSWLPWSIDGHLNRPRVGRYLGWRRRHGNGDAEALSYDRERYTNCLYTEGFAL